MTGFEAFSWVSPLFWQYELTFSERVLDPWILEELRFFPGMLRYLFRRKLEELSIRMLSNPSYGIFAKVWNHLGLQLCLLAITLSNELLWIFLVVSNNFALVWSCWQRTLNCVLTIYLIKWNLYVFRAFNPWLLYLTFWSPLGNKFISNEWFKSIGCGDLDINFAGLNLWAIWLANYAFLFSFVILSLSKASKSLLIIWIYF